MVSRGESVIRRERAPRVAGGDLLGSAARSSPFEGAHAGGRRIDAPGS